MSATTHFSSELLSDISQFVTVGSIGEVVRIVYMCIEFTAQIIFFFLQMNVGIGPEIDWPFRYLFYRVSFIAGPFVSRLRYKDSKIRLGSCVCEVALCGLY